MQIKLYMIISETEFNKCIYTQSKEMEYYGYDGARINTEVSATYFSDFEKSPTSNDLFLLSEEEKTLLQKELDEHLKKDYYTAKGMIRNLNINSLIKEIYSFNKKTEIKISFKEVLINLNA